MISSLVFSVFGTFVPSVRTAIRNAEIEASLREELIRTLPEIDTAVRREEPSTPVASAVRSIVYRYLDAVRPDTDLLHYIRKSLDAGHRISMVASARWGDDFVVKALLDEMISRSGITAPIQFENGFSMIGRDAVYVTADPEEAERCIRIDRHAIIYVDAARFVREVELRRMSGPRRSNSYVE